MEAVRAVYFTDLLCVWAYLNQVRIDELESKLRDQVEIEPRFCSVFGDVPGKLERSWAERGGAEAYAKHIQKVVSSYDHVSVHKDVWSKIAPYSSMPAHLFLCAVRCLERDGAIEFGEYAHTCWAVRSAFFRDAKDISMHHTLCEVAESCRLPVAKIEEGIKCGRAHAELSSDLELGRQYDIKLSPSMVLNEGRQRLNGNVGFRVIEANVKELMHKRELEEASWC